MKQKKDELDVDFIGGQGSLTAEEAAAISEFIKAKKANDRPAHSKQNNQASVIKGVKVIA